MTMKEGKTSTEHARALRAELLGFILVLVGLVVAVKAALLERPIPGGIGVIVCAIGAHLVAHTAAAYARARGDVKAAAVRRPADTAPRI